MAPLACTVIARHLVLVLVLALVAAGCPAPNRRVLDQPASLAPALVGDEEPGDIERKWGKPDRTLEVEDQATGARRTVWQYDRFVDTNGSKVTTSVTFSDGRLARVDTIAMPSTPASQGMSRDSAAKRDME